MPSHSTISQGSLRADNAGISKSAALLGKNWKPIKTSKPGGKIPGIYLIGLKILNYVIYLYLGRSNDVRRRLFEHMQPARKSKQKIDDFIQFKGEDVIMVKWIEDPDQKDVKGEYLDYVESKYYKLHFNMKAGAPKSEHSRLAASKKPDHLRIINTPVAQTRFFPPFLFPQCMCSEKCPYILPGNTSERKFRHKNHQQ